LLKQPACPSIMVFGWCMDDSHRRFVVNQ
jgi:hypothetical protein